MALPVDGDDVAICPEHEVRVGPAVDWAAAAGNVAVARLKVAPQFADEEVVEATCLQDDERNAVVVDVPVDLLISYLVRRGCTEA